MRNSIVIYRPSPFGRMYLCKDGTTSSCRDDASEHWETQFTSIVTENWIVNTPERAKIEVVTR